MDYLFSVPSRCLKEDFQSQHRTQYRAAHVYFTEGIVESHGKAVDKFLGIMIGPIYFIFILRHI